jgi:ligand-binding sensor domain-containing protein
MKYFSLIFLYIPFVFFGQIQEKLIGNIPIQNFAPKDYKGEPQVNCVTKDSRGILYFGHNSGLSIFDGTKWTSIKIDDRSVQSIFISQNDNIYIGSEGQFGELITNELGQFVFKVISKSVAAKYQIGTIFSINKWNDYIVFSDFDKLYIYSENKKIEIILSKDKIQETYLIHNDLYINIQQKGLFYLNGKNILTPIEGNEQLIGKKINQVLPLGKDSILIVESEHLYSSPKDKIILRQVNLSTDDKFSYSVSYQLSNNDYLIGLSNSINFRKLFIFYFKSM